MTAYTLTSDKMGKRLTDAQGNIIITWGKGDKEETSLEISAIDTLTYEECEKEFGLSFLKVVNPEEAKKVTETLEARYEEAKKVNHKTETPATEKEIIAYKVASGEWFDTGMCIKDAKTGKRIKDVMSFKI